MKKINLTQEQKESNKHNFLQLMTFASPEELNEIIKDKGKGPKALPIIQYYK